MNHVNLCWLIYPVEVSSLGQLWSIRWEEFHNFVNYITFLWKYPTLVSSDLWYWYDMSLYISSLCNRPCLYPDFFTTPYVSSLKEPFPWLLHYILLYPNGKVFVFKLLFPDFSGRKDQKHLVKLKELWCFWYRSYPAELQQPMGY